MRIREEHQSPDGKLEKYQRIEARMQTKERRPRKREVHQDEHGKYKFTRSRQQEHMSVPGIMECEAADSCGGDSV